MVLDPTETKTDYFMYLSSDENGMLLPTPTFQTGVVSVRLSQTGEFSLTCEKQHSTRSTCSSKTCTVKNGGTNTGCVAANADLATCTAANIVNTCIVTGGGINTACAAAILDSATCAAATTTGANGDAANACIFVDNSIHTCIFVSDQTTRDADVISIAVSNGIVSASFGTCSITMPSACALSTSFITTGAHLFVGSFDSTNTSRWTKPGFSLYTRSGSSNTLTTTPTTLSRFESQTPFSTLVASDRGIDLSFTNQPSDLSVSKPVLRVVQVDMATVFFKPIYAPIFGNFSVYLSGIDKNKYTEAELYGFLLRFTSTEFATSGKTAVAPCICAFEGSMLKCVATLNKNLGMPYGSANVGIAFGGSTTFYELVDQTMTFYSISTTSIVPTCAPAETTGTLQVALTLGILPVSIQEMHQFSGIAPAVSILGELWTPVNNGSDGTYTFEIPQNYPNDVYPLAVSMFKNQTTWMPTDFLYYNIQAGTTAMSLAPLASPAGRKGISTSFDSIYLDGSMFHELMQPQLQFKDLTTNVVHKSSGTFVTEFSLMPLNPRIPPKFVNSYLLNASRAYTATRSLILKKDIIDAGISAGGTVLSGLYFEVDLPGKNGVLVDIIVKISAAGIIPEIFETEEQRTEAYQNALKSTNLVFQEIGGPELMSTSQLKTGDLIFFDRAAFSWNGQDALVIEIQRKSIQSIEIESTGNIVHLETLFSRSATKSSDTLNELDNELWSFERAVPKLKLSTFGMATVVKFLVPATAAVDADEQSRLHQVKLSLDSGNTVTPSHSWNFKLLNSRTEISVLRPTTGPITGGTSVKVYGIMFVDIPSFLCKWTLTVTEPYSRQFEIFSTALRVPYGTDSAYLEVKTPSVPRRDILMPEGVTSVRAALDISTNNGHVYARRDIKRGRMKVFDYQPVPILLNATCQGSTCLGSHTLPERGNVEIRVFAKNVFFSAGKKTNRRQEEKKNDIEL